MANYIDPTDPLANDVEVFDYECPSCGARLDDPAHAQGCFEPDAQLWCERHQAFVDVVDVFTYTGFAGGRCYGVKLSCGCWDADESNDVLAAM